MDIKELTSLIRSKHPSWDDETKKIVDYLWSAWEADNVELATFMARVAKEWPTKGSNLYTDEEVEQIAMDNYNDGLHEDRYPFQER